MPTQPADSIAESQIQLVNHHDAVAASRKTTVSGTSHFESGRQVASIRPAAFSADDDIPNRSVPAPQTVFETQPIRVENESSGMRAGQPRADQPAAFPLEHFVARALAVHPRIAAARHELAAALNRPAQARGLANPMLADTFWPFNGNALQTAGGKAANQIAINQAIPWLEKLHAKEAVAVREVQIARAKVAKVEREVTEAVQLAAIEIWLSDRAVEVLDETSLLIEELIDNTQAEYRTGGSQKNWLRAQLEADRLADRRVQFVSQKKVAQADLATLLHQPVEAMEVSDELLMSNPLHQLEELFALAEQCNPELQGLAAEIARDREQQRLACLEKYPDFQVGMNWLMLTDQDALSPVATGNDNFGFTVGLSLPIWHHKIDAGIREAVHETAGSMRIYAAERDTVYGKLRRLGAQANATVEQQQLFENRIIPRTEDALRIALADYRGNRTDFPTVLDVYQELLLFELQLARLKATLAGIIVQIERVVGCPVAMQTPLADQNQ